MSEEHTQDEATSHRQQIATSSVEGTVITFTFNDGSTVKLDVAALPQTVREQYAIDGVRNAGRLSFQKQTDPVKAAEALQAKFNNMLSGNVAPARRSDRMVDPLTQALANIYGKTPQYIDDVWYDKYFAQAVSGCTTNTDKRGKVRTYGKTAALDKLRRDGRVKAELDKIARERGSKKPAEKLDLDSLAA
jgi:hypothetical protein